MFYWKAIPGVSVSTKQVNRECVCVCVKVSLSLSPLPHTLSWQEAVYIAHIPPRCTLSHQTEEKLDFLVFLIQTSLVFNSVIVSTPSESSLESLALITREINANERPTPPSFWTKNEIKIHQDWQREREKREHMLSFSRCLYFISSDQACIFMQPYVLKAPRSERLTYVRVCMCTWIWFTA